MEHIKSSTNSYKKNAYVGLLFHSFSKYVLGMNNTKIFSAV
jgi:hypothetical protein